MKKIWIIGLLGIGMCSSCQESYQEKFIRIAQAENAACPRRLNETIVMDSTRYDAQRNVVHYYYTLSGAMDDAVYMKAKSTLSMVQGFILFIIPIPQERYWLSFHFRNSN